MAQLYTFHLFAGAGGGILADALLGHCPVGAVEIEPYPRSVLLARQRDGLLPPFPIWDDVCTYRADNPETAPHIEALRAVRHQLAICGGYPCQGHSVAGKGAGLDDARSALWYEFARIVRMVRPRFVFVENSPAVATDGGLLVILGQLASMGYNARWGVYGADDAGAPHRRKRMWVLATHADSEGEPTSAEHGEASGVVALPHPNRDRLQGQQQARSTARAVVGVGSAVSDSAGFGLEKQGRTRLESGTAPPGNREANLPVTDGQWSAEPDMGRVAHGVPDRVDRLKSLGNGQVPQVAALAWETLT